MATRLAPGDPVRLIVGELAPLDLIEALRAKYGLDKPLYVQFFYYLVKLFQGDFGFSFAHRQDVLEVIFDRVPATLLLVGTSIIFALFVGITLATMAAKRLNSLLDNLLSSISMIGYSIPVFWFAQLLIFFFAVKLDLFPAGGMIDLRNQHVGFYYALDVLYHLVLPALSLGLVYTGLIARLTRAEMADVLTQDFILTARAKGIPENRVMSRHVLRNALSPVTTMTGVLIGLMFAGAVFTETIFSWPGLGRLLYDSLFSRDYPVVTAMFIITSIILIIVNTIIDVLYCIIDPRVRIE
jgi:peptide/nickel transport system permease protein